MSSESQEREYWRHKSEGFSLAGCATRSITDYDQASAYRREAFKLIITLNSGSAIAVLTLISTIFDDEPTASKAWIIVLGAVAIVVFMAGAVLGVLATRAMSEHRQNWGNYWEEMSKGDKADDQNVHLVAKLAENNRRRARRFADLGLLSLLFGVSLVFLPLAYFVWDTVAFG